MRHIMILTLGAIVALAAGAIAQTAGTTDKDPQASEQARVQAQNLGPGFVDNDGNGICDYYEAGTPGQGRGYGARAGRGAGVGPGFVDNDNDGICDYFQAGTPGQGRAGRGGRAYGAFNGTGTGVGPRDGSGYGVRAGGGVGVCDGAGPRGNRGGRGPRR
jgi:hypothetical protein